MHAFEPTAGKLRSALKDSSEAYRAGLADYQGGLLDSEALRHALFRSGLVIHLNEAWLLDGAAQRWWRYDGLRMSDTSSPARGSGSDLPHNEMLRLINVACCLGLDDFSPGIDINQSPSQGASQ